MVSEAQGNKLQTLMAAIQIIFPNAKTNFSQHQNYHHMGYLEPVKSQLIIEAVGKASWFERAETFEIALASLQTAQLTRREIKKDTYPDVFFFYYELAIIDAERFLDEVSSKFVWPMYSKQFDDLLEQELLKHEK